MKHEEKVFHKCLVCRKIMLLDAIIISRHVKKHNINWNWEQYNCQFLQTNGVTRTNARKNVGQKVRLDGFQNFLAKLSLPKYPAMEAILNMKNVDKKTMIDTTFNFCENYHFVFV